MLECLLMLCGLSACFSPRGCRSAFTFNTPNLQSILWSFLQFVAKYLRINTPFFPYISRQSKFQTHHKVVKPSRPMILHHLSTEEVYIASTIIDCVICKILDILVSQRHYCALSISVYPLVRPAKPPSAWNWPHLTRPPSEARNRATTSIGIRAAHKSIMGSRGAIYWQSQIVKMKITQVSWLIITSIHLLTSLSSISILSSRSGAFPSQMQRSLPKV